MNTLIKDGLRHQLAARNSSIAEMQEALGRFLLLPIGQITIQYIWASDQMITPDVVDYVWTQIYNVRTRNGALEMRVVEPTCFHQCCGSVGYIAFDVTVDDTKHELLRDVDDLFGLITMDGIHTLTHYMSTCFQKWIPTITLSACVALAQRLLRRISLQLQNSVAEAEEFYLECEQERFDAAQIAE